MKLLTVLNFDLFLKYSETFCTENIAFSEVWFQMKQTTGLKQNKDFYTLWNFLMFENEEVLLQQSEPF